MNGRVCNEVDSPLPTLYSNDIVLTQCCCVHLRFPFETEQQVVSDKLKDAE